MVIVPLTQGRVTIIDDEDENRVSQYKWCAYKHKDKNTWYATHNFKTIEGTFYGQDLHRFIMNAKPGIQIDHKDGNGLNNQKSNLRFCNNTENHQNQKKSKTYNGKPTTSIHKGVVWYKKEKRFRSRISIDGKRIHLGWFKNEIEAAKSYDKAATEHFKEFANINNV